MREYIYIYNASFGFNPFWQTGGTELESNREQIAMSAGGFAFHLSCLVPGFISIPGASSEVC